MNIENPEKLIQSQKVSSAIKETAQKVSGNQKGATTLDSLVDRLVKRRFEKKK
ncbi:MAG: hypothetical protein WC346_10000 [Methanogenium sp.]|jgi:hypothetical protein